jgi:hypothetical protein
MLSRPEPTEYPEFYGKYVALAGEKNVLDALRESGRAMSAALDRVPEERGAYRYEDGKWTIKTLIGHVNDAERIFTYRALRLARGDATPLPSFDENAFAAAAASDMRTVADLAAEFACLRESSVRLFASFPDDAWTRSGIVSMGPVTVRALAYITNGHAQHHLNVLKERYGV